MPITKHWNIRHGEDGVIYKLDLSSSPIACDDTASELTIVNEDGESTSIRYMSIIENNGKSVAIPCTD